MHLVDVNRYTVGWQMEALQKGNRRTPLNGFIPDLALGEEVLSVSDQRGVEFGVSRRGFGTSRNAGLPGVSAVVCEIKVPVRRLDEKRPYRCYAFRSGSCLPADSSPGRFCQQTVEIQPPAAVVIDGRPVHPQIVGQAVERTADIRQ